MLELILATDWTVLAAVVQAVSAIFIVGLTVALVASNKKALDEMRKEREHERYRRSVHAAQELTRAVTELMVKWRGAEDDPGADTGGLVTAPPEEWPRSAEDKRRQALQEWRAAYLTERANIVPAALSEDLARFHAIVSTAVTDWDAIALMDDDGDPTHAPRRRPDNRSYRLGWCEDRLVERLEAHRRGADVTTTILPRRAVALLELPPGEGPEGMEALVDASHESWL